MAERPMPVSCHLWFVYFPNLSSINVPNLPFSQYFPKKVAVPGAGGPVRNGFPARKGACGKQFFSTFRIETNCLMWELLLQNFARRHVFLSPEEVAVLQSLFVHKKFRRHQYILQQGDVARYDNFIIKGLARTYQVDDKGQERILRFTPEEWWTGDMYSFLTGQPTQYNVDCLEDTEVLRITRENLESLYERVPQINKYFRQLYQNSIISYNQRLGSALSKSALERYHEFIERYPQIEQRVPNHQIAAYLGITPQSLSRLRKERMTMKRS